MNQPGAAKIWLVIPVKPLGQGKSRLAARLTPDERAAISRQMLRHLLAVAVGHPYLAGVLVISRDPQVLALAGALGAAPVVEQGEGINLALEQAAQVAAALGAQAILALPGDLPLITGEDIERLVQGLPQPAGICLAASKDGGTNGLAMQPVGAIPFAFGAESFRRHQDLAQATGLPIRTVESPTLAVDLDSPADLWTVGG